MILLKVPFAKDGSKLHECYTPDDVFDCALSVDGKRVVVAGKFGWNVLDFDKFPFRIVKENCISNIATVYTERYVTSVNFSEDGSKLSVADERGCYVFNGNGRELLCTLCKGEIVTKALMSPNNMILAVGCDDKVCVFNVATGDCLHTFPIDGSCCDIQYSNNGQRIFFGDIGNIYGHDVYSGAQEFQCQLPQGTLNLVSWNNTLLVPCKDGNVHVINAALTHQITHEQEVHQYWCSLQRSSRGTSLLFSNQETYCFGAIMSLLSIHPLTSPMMSTHHPYLFRTLVTQLSICSVMCR
jgi:WD40 repeat protein